MCIRDSFNPTTGAQIWHYQTGCFGGGGTTPSLWQGRLYVRDTANAPSTILDPATGTFLGHIPTRLLPAFNGTDAFLVDQNSNYPGLVAWDVTIMTAVWSLPPPAGHWFNNAPVYANGFVYTTTENGILVAANATTGAQVWSDNLGVPITGTTNMDLAAETSGISVGDGSLLLPVNTALVAYTGATYVQRAAAVPTSSAVPFRHRTAPPAIPLRSSLRSGPERIEPAIGDAGAPGPPVAVPWSVPRRMTRPVLL